MSVDEYLDQPRVLRREIRRMERRIRSLRRPKKRNSGEALSGRRLADLLAESQRVQDEMRQKIGRVKNAIYRELLIDRYVLCMKWEDVAAILHYNPTYVFEVGKKAREALDKVLQETYQ